MSSSEGAPSAALPTEVPLTTAALTLADSLSGKSRRSPYRLRSRSWHLPYEAKARPSGVRPVSLACALCGGAPRVPVTPPCGHTACRGCLEASGVCHCGEPAPHVLATDVLVQRLLCLVGFVDDDDSDLKENLGRYWPAADAAGSDLGCGDSKQRHHLGLLNGASPRRPRRNSTAIRKKNVRDWLRNGELDCSLCGQPFRRPVATPCGHTYCRACVERCMDFRNSCPLCKADLTRFNVDATSDSQLIRSAVAAAGCPVEAAPDHDDRLPLFVCTVAYPMMPCPLYVFEPRYRLMLRRILRTGTRRFGMVAPEPDGGYCDTGTVLEIRDCLRLEDGCSILATIGVSRFRVLQRDIRDGYDVAHTAPLLDVRSDARLVRALSAGVRRLQRLWLQSLTAPAVRELQAAYGACPGAEASDEDGPHLQWWALALTPLPTNIKVSILKNSDPLKRLEAVGCALQIFVRKTPCTALDKALKGN